MTTERIDGDELDKSIKREPQHQGKLYTITLAPEGVKVVEKGKRNGKELSWASIITVTPP